MGHDSMKNTQLNVRYSAEDVRKIREIARLEDRDISEIVRFLVRWGIGFYEAAGSISGMKHTNITVSTSNQGDNAQPNVLEVTRWAKETKRNASMRLSLRQEAMEIHGSSNKVLPNRKKRA